MDASPYGLSAFWSQADYVIKGVAILLVLMSIASWSVIVMKAWHLWRLRHMAFQVGPLFWDANSLDAGIVQLAILPDNPFHQVAEAGARASHHHEQRDQAHHNKDGALREHLSLSDWLTRSLRQAIDEAASTLQSGLAVLASVSSTAPFVGLFGTVWGIYHALVAIGTQGQASIDQVAGPVGEALIMTALGLAVAIPATLGYNALVRGNKAILAQLHKFGFDLHALFVTGARFPQKTCQEA